MKFRIEPMLVEHLEQCVDVFIAAFTEPHHFVWQAQDVRIRLADLWDEPKRIGLVAIDDGDLALSGFAIGNFVQVADGPSLRIGELCVHPSRQGYGLGSRLLVGMEELAAAEGALSAYLSVQPNSVDFCRRLGYREQHEWVTMGRRLHERESDKLPARHGAIDVS